MSILTCILFYLIHFLNKMPYLGLIILCTNSFHQLLYCSRQQSLFQNILERKLQKVCCILNFAKYDFNNFHLSKHISYPIKIDMHDRKIILNIHNFYSDILMHPYIYHQIYLNNYHNYNNKEIDSFIIKLHMLFNLNQVHILEFKKQ